MIDTDKYEGHTPTAWMRKMNLNGLYSHILRTCTHPERWLIEDAPLLLAEVKRMRAVFDSHGECHLCGFRLDEHHIGHELPCNYEEEE